MHVGAASILPAVTCCKLIYMVLNNFKCALQEYAILFHVRGLLHSMKMIVMRSPKYACTIDIEDYEEIRNNSGGRTSLSLFVELLSFVLPAFQPVFGRHDLPWEFGSHL